MKEADKRRPNLTEKKFWTKSSPENVAQVLGYEPDEAFNNALERFIVTRVKDARVTLFLGVLAQGFFRGVKPPLQRSSNGQSPEKK